ncbi:MAG: PaaI family thioesterase [Acidimicrobiia bacterium]
MDTRNGLPTTEEINAFLIQAFPAAAADGIRCVDVAEGSATARWPYDESTLRPGGYISGPVMFSLADSALWFASFTSIGIEAMAVTSEMSIRFVRPAVGGDLMARATIQSTSRRRLVGSIELWIDGAPDRLVAVAQGTYVKP